MKRFLAFLLVLIMLLSMMPAVSLAAQYASVTGGWLRLRAGASFEADTITSYYTDTVVEILGTSGKWYHVRTPDGRTGFMYSDYLKLGASSSSAANAYVTSHNGYGVRLRKGPGTGYRVIRVYDVGTPVTVLESGVYWSKVSINGTTGYMMSQFLSTAAQNGNGNEKVVCYATIWSNNGYGVRLRSGPSRSFGKIGVYSVGTTVAVLEKGTTWDRIRVGSRTGWMMNEFLVYQNTNEMSSVTLNTIRPTVGTVMSVKAMSPSGATVSYAWLVDGNVRGTNSTYTVAAADVGKKIQLKVTGYGKYTGYALSAATEKVISNTQISGLKLSTTAPVVGDVISAVITPADATVSYAWKVDGYQAGNKASYTVTASDAGKVIELIVTGSGLYSGTMKASTAAVVATSTLTSAAIRNDSNATVGAAPMVGDTLTAVVTPAQATVTYQWKRNGIAISGATGSSYNLTEADFGAQMSVSVKGTGMYVGEKTASISDAVQARPQKPTIDAYALPDAIVGQTYATQLTAQGGGEIKWALEENAMLPEGLSMTESGAITGTPVREGTFTFAVEASNVSGTDQKTFTLVIAPVAKPELTVGSVTIPAQTEGYAAAAPAAVTITNIGKADAHLQQLWTEGTNGSCFIVNEDGSSVIAANDSDTTWTVQPVAGLAAGTYTATFVVRYDDNATASGNVSFTVNAQTPVPEPEVPVPEPEDPTPEPENPAPETPDPVPETVYTVTVSGGSADKATAKAGETVTILLGAVEEGKVFSGWSSSQVSFADANAASTTFTMPESDVTITATYAEQTPEPVKKPELTIQNIVLPTVEEGYAQAGSQAAEIFNAGNGDAVLTALYTEGGEANAFVVNDNGSTVIAAGASDTSWNIRAVSGLSAGTYNTEFVVEYNGGKAKAQVSFTVKEKPPVMYDLQVENGSGSGAYTEGTSVAISANAPASGMEFDRWTASSGTLADAYSADTTFTMPGSGATITAVYKEKAKVKLGTPVVTWSLDGTSVSWTAVEGASGYQYYRLKVDGTETSRKIISDTSYTFQSSGTVGDIFYVRAVDSTETYLDGDYASAVYE